MQFLLSVNAKQGPFSTLASAILTASKDLSDEIEKQGSMEMYFMIDYRCPMKLKGEPEELCFFKRANSPHMAGRAHSITCVHRVVRVSPAKPCTPVTGYAWWNPPNP